MSTKRDLSRLIAELESIDGVSNIEIDDDVEDKDLASGDFEFNEGYYSFILSGGAVLSILEISYSFTFEEYKTEKENFKTYISVNDFNRKSVAIKASVLKTKKKEELNVEFTYGVLNGTKGCESPYDLEPAINILQMAPLTMSKLLTKHGLAHKELSIEDDQEEGS